MVKIPRRRRPAYLLVRLTEIERRTIEAAARASDAASPSEWIRQTVMREVERLGRERVAGAAEVLALDAGGEE